MKLTIVDLSGEVYRGATAMVMIVTFRSKDLWEVDIRRVVFLKVPSRFEGQLYRQSARRTKKMQGMIRIWKNYYNLSTLINGTIFDEIRCNENKRAMQAISSLTHEKVAEFTRLGG